MTAVVVTEEHPRLAEGVRVVAPLQTGAPWIIRDGPDRYFRVSEHFARVAQLLDGTLSLGEVTQRLGGPWTVDHVREVWERLVDRDLVGDRPARPEEEPRRFKYVPPLTLQYTILDPYAVLRPLSRPISWLMGRTGFLLQVGFAVAGVLVLLLRPDVLWSAASTPLGLTSYAAVAVGFVVATAIHEFGHGAVLVRHGGRPSRMGVMLFYLAPAFFCDVSDGWRLPHARQRVQVACAGITSQAVLGSVAAFAALIPQLSGIRHELVLFAAGAYLGGILNLVPFVKFDGYLALMSHVDVPGLRDKAMTDARDFAAWVFFGARRTSTLPQFRWAVPYGMACLVFPFVLVSQAVNLWATALAQMGPLGLVGMLLGIAGTAGVVVRGWLRMARHARTHGAGAVRVGLVSAAAAAAVVVALVGLHLPRTIQGGFFVAADGSARLILPARVPAGVIERGDEVHLFRSGVLGRQDVGTVRITDPRPVAASGPISAVAPIVTTLTTTYPHTVALSAPTADAAPQSGIAIWSGDAIPLWRFVVDTYIAPLL